MKSRTIGAALAAAALLSLSACVTGVDSETKAALKQTLESVQELTDLWQERLDELDAGGSKPTPEEDAGPAGGLRLDDYGTLTVDRTVNDKGNIDSMADVYGNWGLSATDGGYGLFEAYLSGERRHHLLTGEIEDTISYTYGGFPSPSVPLYGSAVWIGEVRAIHVSSEHFGYDAEAGRVNSITGHPIQGDSRIEADFSGRTVDVEFSALASGPHTWPDMDWTNLPLERSTGWFGDATLSGGFYGLDHQGVAGFFERNDMRGVFGALRE